MKLPDITPAQIAAAVKLIVGIGAALGLNVSGETSDALTAAIVAGFAFVAAVLTLADAIIRNGRSRALQYQPNAPAPEKPTP